MCFTRQTDIAPRQTSDGPGHPPDVRPTWTSARGEWFMHPGGHREVSLTWWAFWRHTCFPAMDWSDVEWDFEGLTSRFSCSFLCDSEDLELRGQEWTHMNSVGGRTVGVLGRAWTGGFTERRDADPNRWLQDGQICFQLADL